MRSKIVYCLLAGLLLSACSNKNPDHPLVIPPEFDVMPGDVDDNKKEKAAVDSNSDDIRELKDLLLD